MFATLLSSPFLAVIQEDVPWISLEMWRHFFNLNDGNERPDSIPCVVLVTLVLVVISLLTGSNGSAHHETTDLLWHTAATEV